MHASKRSAKPRKSQYLSVTPSEGPSGRQSPARGARRRGDLRGSHRVKKKAGAPGGFGDRPGPGPSPGPGGFSRRNARRGSTLWAAGEEAKDDQVTLGGEYQLGEAIGKGGFGTVYRALNILNGKTVAVKRVSIKQVSKQDLEAIEMEVDLLKKLSHANIVKYIRAVRSPEFLNIVLEMVENGSLSQQMDKFGGKFQEPLVKIYTAQVLQGLVYLHENGVIHRDIKGANILATKDGVMKLADFGVATRLDPGAGPSTAADEQPVGTPYWMAPEVIEMSAPSPACDVWSVGCTAIELLTGSPPYFDLQPMPALFRIVEDPLPPLPTDISPLCKEFLQRCFIKDPNLRPTAAELLKHRWLKTKPAKPSVPLSPKATPTKVATIKEEENTDDDDEDDWDSDPKPVKRGKPAAAAAVAADSDGDDDWDDEIDDGPSAAAPVKSSKPAMGARSGANAKNIGGNVRGGAMARGGKGKAGGGARGASVLSPSGQRVAVSRVVKDAEDEADEFDDLFDDAEVDLDKVNQELYLSDGDSGSESGSESSESDAFDVEDEEVDPSVLASQKRAEEVLQTIQSLNPDSTHIDILTTCQQLTKFMQEDPAQVTSIVAHHGVIPIMEILQVSNTEVLRAILHIVSELVDHDRKFLQTLCTVGLIPAIQKLVLPTSPLEIRLDAARFLRHFCSHNVEQDNLTRRMFTASNGLSAIVRLFLPTGTGGQHADPAAPPAPGASTASSARAGSLIGRSAASRKNRDAPMGSAFEVSSDYATHRQLVSTGVDCIYLILERPNHPRNDFLRIMAKNGLLYPMAVALTNAARDRREPQATEDAVRMARLFRIFAEGDMVVKAYLTKREVLQCLLPLLDPHACGLGNPLPPDIVLPLIRTVRLLAQVPSTRDVLEECGAVERLVPLLAASDWSDVVNQAIQALFYLIQLKKSRQEKAALAGAVPHLQRIINSKHPLVQFVYPVVCDLAKTSDKARAELKKFRGVDFYLDLLSVPYWQARAMMSLASWLEADSDRIEPQLLLPENLTRIVQVLRNADARGEVLVRILSSLNKMFAASPRLNNALALDTVFLTTIADRLRRTEKARQSNVQSPLIRKELLQLIGTQFNMFCSEARWELSSASGPPKTRPLLERFCWAFVDVLRSIEKCGQVIMEEMARKTLTQFGEWVDLSQAKPDSFAA